MTKEQAQRIAMDAIKGGGRTTREVLKTAFPYTHAYEPELFEVLVSRWAA